jgi:uncharacterized membrane protein YfcA
LIAWSLASRRSVPFAAVIVASLAAVLPAPAVASVSLAAHSQPLHPAKEADVLLPGATPGAPVGPCARTQVDDHHVTSTRLRSTRSTAPKIFPPDHRTR